MAESTIVQNVTGDYNIFSGTGDVYVYNSPVPLSPDDAKKRRDLEILCNRVKEIWIDGVLKNSLLNVTLLKLCKVIQIEAVAPSQNPLRQVIELPNQPTRVITTNEKIINIFDDLNGGLLILGEPGSGKTITLLELARDLLKRVEQDVTFSLPIPTVFNLSTWTKDEPLMDWMTEQLQAIYQIPRHISKQWLKENRVLPMLDGLDEVRSEHQLACVEAINNVVQQFGLAGLVVCSRVQEYTNLSIKLKLNGAVLLQPLTLDQVEDYLNNVGDDLVALQTVLRDDKALRTLAESPLTLGIMTLAYRKMSVQELTNLILNTSEKRRRHLFETYIERMFKRKGERSNPYTKEQTKRWLIWLAQGMQQHNQSVFLIEQLQPSWLSNPIWILIYIWISRIITTLVTGLILIPDEPTISEKITSWLLFAVIGGVGLSLVDSVRLGNPFQLLPRRFQAISTVLAIAGVFGLTSLTIEDSWYMSWVYALIFGVLFGWKRRNRSPQNEIQTTGGLNWSWKYAVYASIGGSVLGALVGIILGFNKFIQVVMFFALLGGMYGGLQGQKKINTTIPNQGIRLSARNAVLSGGIIGISFALIVVFINFNEMNIFSFTSNAMFLGLPFAIWFGGIDTLNHYTLRMILYFKKDFALNCKDLLNHATNYIFLRKVGGGYIFIHRLLLEHFASVDKMSNSPKPS